MTFTTFTFLVFLIITFVGYWSMPTRRAQNTLLLIAGYLFYGWWDLRFGVLLLASSCVDYFVGKRLAVDRGQGRAQAAAVDQLPREPGHARVLQVRQLLRRQLRVARLRRSASAWTRWSSTWCCPSALSFYTFQTLSYALDIYRGHLQPSKSFLDYLAFVSFFPQLVAGPIERAGHMLPQFHEPRSLSVEDIQAGLRQMLWGFVKKLVLADNLARVVDAHYRHVDGQPGPVLAVATVAFAFQIYLDFSGLLRHRDRHGAPLRLSS